MAETMDCTNIWLKYGSTGSTVKTLQKNLKSLGYYIKSGRYTLVADGKYKEYTRSEVKRFQKNHGLTKDGIVGPKTCQTINQLIQKTNNNPTSKATTTNNSEKNIITPNTTKTVNPYQINTDNNIFSSAESNLHIQGIHLKSSSVNPDNAFRSGNWSSIPLANGGNYDYLEEDLPLQYTIVVYLRNDEFEKLKNEFWKMGKQMCEVTGSGIEPGVYMISLKPENLLLTHKKVTLTLKEHLG